MELTVPILVVVGSGQGGGNAGGAGSSGIVIIRLPQAATSTRALQL